MERLSINCTDSVHSLLTGERGTVKLDGNLTNHLPLMFSDLLQTELYNNGVRVLNLRFGKSFSKMVGLLKIQFCVEDYVTLSIKYLTYH